MSVRLTAVIGCRAPTWGSDGPCVFQGRLGVPAAHPVGWAADLADSLSRSRPLPVWGEWTRRDLNPRPPACKAGALPAELRARTGAPSGPVGRWIRRHETDFLATCEPSRDRIVPGRPAGPGLC